MAPKAPEKSPQSHQQTQAHAIAEAVIVKPHSSPFYISAHYLCHNKRLKQKRSKYAECIRNALSQRKREAAAGRAIYNNNNNTCTKKTDDRRQRLSHLTAEVTIDLLSDDEDNAGNNIANNKPNNFRGRMCLERAAILGLMPVERLQNGPPPLIPIVNNNKQRKHMQPAPQLQVQQNQQQHQPRKRKSRPQKRKSLPPPVLLNNESIVLSDDSDAEQEQQQQPQPHIPFISPSITIAPDLTVVYPSSQQIPCHVSPQNTMQVDEEVTISLVPRSGTAATCSKRSPSEACNDQTATVVNQQQSPAFPMLPDETTVHTVIANRIYELSLTKLREGLASCGIPEFNGGSPGQQKKISPPRRKGAVKPPPEMISPPQAPISLKLSSDLSISLISDDEDDGRHHRNNENILSPAFLQKLPVNVSIAPVNITTPRSSTVAVDPRKLKFG